jgi:membrane-bound metal-dependent hydrolase YbcI (DUF457 family)
MAQAGIHSIVGIAVKKWSPDRAWLMLGILLGSMLPDADNLAVAVATVAKLPAEGLHRTFTHSLFTVVAVMVVFYIVARITKQPRWNNLGVGLGIGILLHILLDLLIWFNGVEILWPIPSWINLWSGVTPPIWFDKLMMTAEFLFFALFFIGLSTLARRQGTDLEYLRRLRTWSWLEFDLFLIFTALVFFLQKGFMTPYGLVYLLSLGLAMGVTIRMRKTVDGMAHKQSQAAD